MLERGATTLWESWEYPANAPSQNHPMFGSVSEWFYRSLLGINPSAPGFRTFYIKLQPAGDLDWARGNYQSAKGLISSDWKESGGIFTLRVVVPPNTRAEIWVPVRKKGTITESSSPAEVTRRERGYAVVETGSGEYIFVSEWQEHSPHLLARKADFFDGHGSRHDVHCNLFTPQC